MIASEIMSRNIHTCQGNRTVEQAAKVMVEKGLRAVSVIDKDRKMIGIFSESDFLGKTKKIPHALVSVKKVLGQTFHSQDIENLYSQAKDKKLMEVVSKDPVIANPNMSFSEVVNIMTQKNVKKLPVVENGEMIGIITKNDLLKAFVKLN